MISDYRCVYCLMKSYGNRIEKADLIISKGQGNLEGLIGEQDRRIFFLLMVKCDVIAEYLGVERGSYVVYNDFRAKSEINKAL